MYFPTGKRCHLRSTCPAEVIWQFINQSWLWMSAYCIGLTGEAAHISSSTNSFFPLAQVKKAAKRDESGKSEKPRC
ncbi:hypothetical protein K443DRAFT_104958 [Laccaria amethystina LaAM-08-1]|uniref:Uncharacterized protein n=1 Tax=Laccaria amethystina LaAM-08-1 TaxID=1095629 RepID=A0A0C9XPD8_9AGAR|nr:hypothetical protein K443DRAFT_104958 [Laccaria amethystina LaAM-08-1]